MSELPFTAERFQISAHYSGELVHAASFSPSSDRPDLAGAAACAARFENFSLQIDVAHVRACLGGGH